jgi:small neutral amino acid transporter SnatA (MarC family)
MDNLAQFTLVTLTSILFIVDPIAVVPAYLVITQDETPAEQRRTAMRACIAMNVLLMVLPQPGTSFFARLASRSQHFARRRAYPLVCRDGHAARRATHSRRT